MTGPAHDQGLGEDTGIVPEKESAHSFHDNGVPQSSCVFYSLPSESEGRR